MKDIEDHNQLTELPINNIGGKTLAFYKWFIPILHQSFAFSIYIYIFTTGKRLVLNSTFVCDLLRKLPVSLFRVQRAWLSGALPTKWSRLLQRHRHAVSNWQFIKIMWPLEYVSNLLHCLLWWSLDFNFCRFAIGWKRKAAKKIYPYSMSAVHSAVWVVYCFDPEIALNVK